MQIEIYPCIDTRRQRDRLQMYAQGLPRNKNTPSMLCIYNRRGKWQDHYLWKQEFERLIELSYLPAGSLWRNDSTGEISEIIGAIDDETTQRKVIVGKKRMRLLAVRIPRLEKYIRMQVISSN